MSETPTADDLRDLLDALNDAVFNWALAARRKALELPGSDEEEARAWTAYDKARLALGDVIRQARS